MTSDLRFQAGVALGGVVLVGVLTSLRFCGAVTLPPKPAAPAAPSGTATQLLGDSVASPSMWKTYLERDATAAGVRTPTPDELSRKLAYRADELRHVLSPGDPPLDAAGLQLTVERQGDLVTLTLANTLDVAVAYQVQTEPSMGAYVCNAAQALVHNALVIAKGEREVRTECAWREGSSVAVTKVETIELLPLSAVYIAQVPPAMFGLDPRTTKGHKASAAASPCSSVTSQMVRTGVERGEITWRDLIDFYARHRCETYPFPYSYRAFKADFERPLPAATPPR